MKPVPPVIRIITAPSETFCGLIVSSTDVQFKGRIGRVSSGIRDEQQPAPELAGRLGYLLKHAWLRMSELTTAALAPFGLDGRELAVLVVLAGGEPASQQEAAQKLGVDRTTMVALLDALEGKGLVTRHPHAQDRRKNVVELTAAGRRTLHGAARASAEAERQFLAALTETAAEKLKDTLRTLVTQPDRAPGR
jgi:DNA-binding MarR family transcriptional regulator